MMTLDHRQHHLESVRTVLTVAVSPIQYLINLPVMMGDWLSESVSSHQQLLDENSGLHAQNLLLKTQIQKLDALQTENMRLRELLDSSFRISERVLIAELLSVDLVPFSQQVVINKGTKDGVYQGQPILDANGIMGQVIFAGPFTSNAMLITDASHSLPVQVNRNGLRAIASGTGESNRLELQHIPNNADIVVGDLLVTSGFGGVFPAGYPAGKIISIEKHPEQPFAEVYAEPSGHLESSREVLLVWVNVDPLLSPEAAPTPAETGIQKDSAR